MSALSCPIARAPFLKNECYKSIFNFHTFQPIKLKLSAYIAKICIYTLLKFYRLNLFARLVMFVLVEKNHIWSILQFVILFTRILSRAFFLEKFYLFQFLRG